MKISANKFVSVTYDLNVGEGTEKELMEKATEERPLQFIFGTGAMLPAFEDHLEGVEPGGKFSFSLTPEKAYGAYNEEHVAQLPKHIFETDGKFDNDLVKEGVTLPMMNAEGEHMNGSVLEVKEESVVMDFNHPLAGETLHFEGEVIDVHTPTEKEIAQMNSMREGGCSGCEGGCGDDENHGPNEGCSGCAGGC